MKQILACLVTVLVVFTFFLLLTACTEAEAEETLPPPTPVEIPTDVEEVIEEPYWPLTDEERDLIERVVSAEARGQSIEGQMAVAQVIMDRCTTRNQSVTRVCTAKAQFAKPYQGEVSDKTKDAVSFVFDKGEKVFDKVTHFYAWKQIPAPYWTEDKDFVGGIDDHRFYADR